MHWQIYAVGGRQGIETGLCRPGTGIPDLDLAMQAGYTSGKGLGMGLPGAQRLMDEMDVQTEVNVGTTVTIRKLLRG